VWSPLYFAQFLFLTSKLDCSKEGVSGVLEDKGNCKQRVDNCCKSFIAGFVFFVKWFHILQTKPAPNNDDDESDEDHVYNEDQPVPPDL
jgi:hypothetical protein